MHKAILVLRVHKEVKVLKVPQVHRERSVLRVHKVDKVLKGR